jgi:hypothetical protein
VKQIAQVPHFKDNCKSNHKYSNNKLNNNEQEFIQINQQNKNKNNEKE